MSRVVKIISNAKVKFGPAPTGGAAIDPAALTDYSCQVTKAAITASANATDVPATFCEPASSINVPSSFSLDLEGLQDWGEAESFSEYTFAHDAEQVAFALYLADEDDPAATGIASLAAGDFGGTAGEPLTFTTSFPILGYPDITGSDGTPLRPPSGGTPATGATAGTPGTWTPSGSTPPANAAGATSAGVVASPATAWTTGQYVQGSTAGSAGEMHWSSSAWVAGRA
jgi:hypothetical protein